MNSISAKGPGGSVTAQNLCLISVMLIFFPIVPGFAETQPFLLLVLGAVLLFSGRISINIYSALLYYFLILFFIVLLVSDFNKEYLVELSKLVLVLMLVVLIYPWIGYGSKGFYRFFIAVHMFIAVLAAFGLASWLSSIFGRYTTLEGGRGISYLASEPSYAATYIFYVTLVYTLGLSKGVFSSRLIQFILLGLLLSTYSLIGFLFFLLILAIDISLGRIHKKIIMGVLTICGGVAFFFTVKRVSTELIPLFTSLFSNDDGLLYLALRFPSASTRFILNGVAMLDGLQRVIYLPFSSFNDALPVLLSNYGLGPVLQKHEVIGALHRAGTELKPQALFPYVVYVFGVLALPLIIHPLKVSFRVLREGKPLFFLACISLVFIFFFYQSQYVNPIQFFVFVIIYKFFEGKGERV